MYFDNNARACVCARAGLFVLVATVVVVVVVVVAVVVVVVVVVVVAARAKQVTSAPGEGSTFRCDLVVHEVRKGAFAAASAAAESSSSSSLAPSEPHPAAVGRAGILGWSTTPAPLADGGAGGDGDDDNDGGGEGGGDGSGGDDGALESAGAAAAAAAGEGSAVSRAGAHYNADPPPSRSTARLQRVRSSVLVFHPDDVHDHCSSSSSASAKPLFGDFSELSPPPTSSSTSSPSTAAAARGGSDGADDEAPLSGYRVLLVRARGGLASGQAGGLG
jgi:hypothetical protein